MPAVIVVDAFLGLMHTCIKLGVAFWDYLGDRIGVAAQGASARTCSRPHPLPADTQPDPNRPGFCPRLPSTN